MTRGEATVLTLCLWLVAVFCLTQALTITTGHWWPIATRWAAWGGLAAWAAVRAERGGR